MDEWSGCGQGIAGHHVDFAVVDGPVEYFFSGNIAPSVHADQVKVRIRWALPDGGWGYPHVFESSTGFNSSGILQEGIYRVETSCSAAICSNEGESDAADISTIFTIYGAQ